MYSILLLLKESGATSGVPACAPIGASSAEEDWGHKPASFLLPSGWILGLQMSSPLRRIIMWLSRLCLCTGNSNTLVHSYFIPHPFEKAGENLAVSTVDVMLLYSLKAHTPQLFYTHRNIAVPLYWVTESVPPVMEKEKSSMNKAIGTSVHITGSQPLCLGTYFTS